MVNITLLTKLSMSLMFLSLINSHPAPECPCKCGSSHGSYPLMVSKQEPVYVQETVVAAPQPPVFYASYSQPPQPVHPEPQLRSMDFTFIPTSVMRRNKPAELPEPFPVSVEIPMSTTFTQSQTLTQPPVEVSSYTPCQSDELTGRMLEFYVEPAAAPTAPENQFEVYDTRIQEIVQEPAKPEMRTLEQRIISPMVSQPKPIYMIQEPTPVHKPVQFFTRISAPEVEESSMRKIFLQSAKSPCGCFKK